MKHFLSIAFCLLLLLPQTHAQRACGAWPFLQEAVNRKPSLAIPFFANSLSLPALQTNSDAATQLPVLKIPVVVHILYNNDQQNISDAQVRSQIDVLNKDYRKLNADTAFIPSGFHRLAADCKIEFQLATADPDGRATKGILRKATRIRAFGMEDDIKSSAHGGSDPWDADSYLNIWVAPLSKGIVGYASPPGIRKDLDGVVISFSAFGTTGSAQPPYNKGRTATHEIGHWLGLRHIWGDTDCGNDYIDDTPPQSSGTNGCPSGVVSTCNNGPNGNMYMNFMDFTDDACISMFTCGQREVMRSLFEADRPRQQLLQSKGLSEPSLPALVTHEDETVSLPVKLYPNPASGFVQVSADQAIDGLPVVIQNYSGQIVLQTSLSKNGRINIGHLRAGLYFIKVGNSKTIKLLKVG